MIDAVTRQQLQYVRVPDPTISLEHFPNFLIAGPQRTGTTWLHAHLRFHPEIFLSEPKELFFFSTLKRPGSPRFQSNDLGWYLQFFRDPLWRRALKSAITLWKYREPYRPTVRGEATASYAALDRDVIREIALLNPNIKLILMIRNPVDRAWSHAKKDLIRKRHRQLEDVPEAEFRQFFNESYQRQCARYVENYDNWATYLKAGNILVGLFDDIASRPEELLLDVMAFLGVRSDRRYVDAGVRKPVNPTSPSEIPPQHRRFLEELLAQELAHLKERFGLSWSR
ncbi:MAG: sulfotransferase domain-containing protein [Candidatus Binatia bacterium]